MSQSVSHLRESIQKKILILDGPMGTELQRQGFETTLPLWSAKALLERPDLVQTIHEQEVAAGADILSTCTFRTHARNFQQAGLTKQTAKRASTLAVRLARTAADTAKNRQVYVAGSISTLEDCYRPDLAPPAAQAHKEHFELAETLKEAGVDVILLETMSTLGETLAALDAIKELDLEVLVSFVPSDHGGLLDGTSFESAIRAIEPYNPIAIGVNCASQEHIDNAFIQMSQATTLPLLAYANGEGEPANDLGWTFEHGLQHTAKDYATHALKWKKHNLRIVGACCGASSHYTQALTQSIHTTIPEPV